MKLFHASHRPQVMPHGFRRVESVVRSQAVEFLERNPHLHASKVRAETAVHASAKPQVSVRAAPVVDDLWVRELVLIVRR